MFAANRTWNCTAPTLSSVTTHLLSTTHQSVVLFCTISRNLRFRMFPLLSSLARVVASAILPGRIGVTPIKSAQQNTRISEFKTKTALKKWVWLSRLISTQTPGTCTKPLKIKRDVYHCLFKRHYADTKSLAIILVSWLFLKELRSISWNSYHICVVRTGSCKLLD